MESPKNEPIEIGSILRKLGEERSPFFSQLQQIYRYYYLILTGVWSVVSCTFIINHLVIRNLNDSFEFYLFSFSLISSVIERYFKLHKEFKHSSLIFESAKIFSGSILLFNRGLFDPFDASIFGYTLVTFAWILDLTGGYLFYLILTLNLNRDLQASRLSVSAFILNISFNLFSLFSILSFENKISDLIAIVIIYLILSLVIIGFRLFLLLTGKNRFTFLFEEYIVPIAILTNLGIRVNPFSSLIGNVIFHFLSFLLYVQIACLLFYLVYRFYQNLRHRSQISDFITQFGQHAPIVHGEDGFECSICLEKFDASKNEEWRRLECQHHFHRKCIDNWALSVSNITCPNCRREIV